MTNVPGDVQQKRAVACSELDKEARGGRGGAQRVRHETPVPHERVDLLQIAPRLNGARIVGGQLVENFRLDVLCA